MLASVALSAESLTWALTLCVGLLAYVLGTLQYRPARGTGDEHKPPLEARIASPTERSREARSLAAVRTKTSVNQSSMDAERAPKTPAKSLAPSMGNGEESEDGEAEDRIRVEVATGAGATVDGAQVQKAQDTDITVTERFVRRKITPRQVHEVAVVQFRDAREAREVTVRESGSLLVEEGNQMSSNESGKGVRAGTAVGGRTAVAAVAAVAAVPGTTERKAVPGRGARPGHVGVSLSRTRTTSDGIPVVDVTRGSSAGASIGLSVGSMGGPGTVGVKDVKDVRDVRTRKGSLNCSNNANNSASRSPSRTSSSASERERVSVVYKSPSSPLSPRAADYTPYGQKKSPGAPVLDRGTYSSMGGQRGVYHTVSGPGKQQHQYSRVAAQMTGSFERANAGSSGEFSQSAPTNAVGSIETSPISTITNISPAPSPMHRRNESENTKLEGAWIMASMAAAELGLEVSDRPDGRQEEGGIGRVSRGNVGSAWQTPWGQPMPVSNSDPISGRSELSGLSNQVSKSFSDTDHSNPDPGNYSLDLYSSLSSLSWANSNSLSSFGSSLHRTTSAVDRPDVFDTIKGIWGDQSEEEKLESALIDS